MNLVKEYRMDTIHSWGLMEYLIDKKTRLYRTEVMERRRTEFFYMQCIILEGTE